MKRSILLKQLFFLIALFLNINLNAQNTLSGTCPGYCDPSGAGAVTSASDAFYMTVNTETNGDITLKIYGVPNNETTAFRNNGLADGVVLAITVDGDANATNKYFTRTISADKMTITLAKQSAIPASAAIVINGILEYRTATSGDESNLWPTVNISFTYGITCTFAQSQLAAPTISNIDGDKKITFSSVTNAASYMAFVFRDADLVYSQAVASGDVLNFVPTITYDYTVKVKAITGDINYLNSDYSAGYIWHLEAGAITLDPSIYCNYLIGSNVNDYAYLSWQTDVDGNVVISISGYAGDTGAKFRAGGMGALSLFTVNGNPASNYFTQTYTAGGTTYTLTLKSGASIVPGDKISRASGFVEWVTTNNTNAYGSYSFPNYVYGSDCSSLPTVTATPATISFSPTTGTQTFAVTGSNLTSDVIITPPMGLTVSPSTITPSSGNVNQVVTASWINGSGTYNGSTIQISGGGLVSNVPVLISTTGFSNYCNKVISQENNGTWAAYMSIAMSTDKTQMILSIAPYASGETATWNSIAHIVVNGGTADAMVASKVISTDKSQCTVTFTSALTDGDQVTFGNALVWTVVRTSTSNTNVYINAIQGPYTVGQTCNLDTATALEPVKPVENLYFYPNPASDLLNVSASVVKTEFYNLQGQLIYSAMNVQQIPLTSFSAGMYIVRLTDKEGNMVSRKLEKQ